MEGQREGESVGGKGHWGGGLHKLVQDFICAWKDIALEHAIPV